MKKELIGKNQNIKTQIKMFKTIILRNKKLRKLLEILDKSELTNYYVTASCVSKTIFNYYHSYNMDYAIDEYEIIYKDQSIKEDYIRRLVGGVDIELKVTSINNLEENLEDYINNQKIIALSVGVKMEQGMLNVYAPYGLNDIFSMTIRGNILSTSNNYLQEAHELHKIWPQLLIK